MRNLMFSSRVFLCIVLWCIGSGAVPATETVESLLANPKRLKELRQQCHDDWDRVGNALCNRVGHATTKQFLGTGTPYTPLKTPPKF
ncbi:entry exclusion lipoprotein TrbK [Dickeya dadantii]|uniref:entry exclusion lipoprotein TrbK n=1 Tax=Dickeya dadantii TaxID=204038 RepID=UPI001C0BA24E|nr:entry exclusion lipoprotein TrbK [Dickeya dadantii]QWT40355.1 entry exclusion lipoprotein TrbK [Dickeya dadantii]